jgi:hypothetical protein
LPGELPDRVLSYQVESRLLHMNMKQPSFAAALFICSATAGKAVSVLGRSVLSLLSYILQICYFCEAFAVLVDFFE